MMSKAWGLLFAGTIVAIAVAAVRAQEPASQPDPNIAASARKIFSGIATGTRADVFPLTAHRWQMKLKNENIIALPTTGPKIKPNSLLADKVDVLRSDAKSAVAESPEFYTPEGSETPPGEVGKLRLYMVKEGGLWVVTAPDKKEAGDDSNLAGGFYHSGSFTYCPNKGILYLPNHFSTAVNCTATAVCR